MYVRDLLTRLVKRWYLVVLGLLLTAGLCVTVFLTAPKSYEAEASMLLLPPKSSVGARGNPYLYLGGLGQAVEVLSARMNSDEVASDVQAAYPNTEFTVGQDTTTTGPILLITVTASSAAEAMEAMAALTDQVDPNLTAMQDSLDIPVNSRIGVMTLVANSEAKVETQVRDRGVIVVAAAGLAGTVLLTGLIDSLLRSRGPRRTRKVEWDDLEDPETPTDAEGGGWIAEPAAQDADDVPEDVQVDAVQGADASDTAEAEPSAELEPGGETGTESPPDPSSERVTVENSTAATRR